MKQLFKCLLTAIIILFSSSAIAGSPLFISSSGVPGEALYGSFTDTGGSAVTSGTACQMEIIAHYSDQTIKYWSGSAWVGTAQTLTCGTELEHGGGGRWGDWTTGGVDFVIRGEAEPYAVMASVEVSSSDSSVIEYAENFILQEADPFSGKTYAITASSTTSITSADLVAAYDDIQNSNIKRLLAFPSNDEAPEQGACSYEGYMIEISGISGNVVSWTGALGGSPETTCRVMLY